MVQKNLFLIRCDITIIWDVPFEIRHGFEVMVPDLLDFLLCCTLAIVLNSSVVSTRFFSKKNFLLIILFVNLMLKQQSTQLPAMKAVISHENF
jgi:hypothetical protein